ncbi:MAG TPA: hypothetical protein VJU14_10805 [Solirubrobacterales bacterium]|nr:hypothetical protein [Solirubrobacterales bacterium]
MVRIALVIAYLIGMVVAVFAMNEDPGGSWGEICLVISVLLGLGTGDYRLATLSLLAIPLTIPFGLPADETGDPVLPLWVGGVMFAAVSALVILLGAFIRWVIDYRLQRRRTLRGSSVS